VREDRDEMGHYVALLRRILILCAVIIAVPVILWTIAAFVRYQVTLPRVFGLPNPLATASTNAPQRATIAEPTQQQSPRLARRGNRRARRVSVDAPVQRGCDFSHSRNRLKRSLSFAGFDKCIGLALGTDCAGGSAL